MMQLITRDGAGLVPPKRGGFYPPHPVALLVLHHEGSGAGPPISLRDGIRRVAAIQNWQMYGHPTVNYRDIAYTSLVDDFAAYEGRDWRTAPGATKGHNAVSKAVCATGDFSSREPSDRLLTNLAAEAVRLWRLGAVDRPSYDGGHRDYVNTQCPGDRLYAAIGEINRRAANIVKGITVATKQYDQAVVGKSVIDDEAGRVLAAYHTLALVDIDDQGRLVSLTHPGHTATVKEPFLVGAAQELAGDFPKAHVIAGGDRDATALAVAQFLIDHPVRRKPGERLVV